MASRAMRSYKQSCGVAKALDVIGDRWSLLIVRELLIREACRYTDLRDGLPGIATNLLAERVRDLEAAGVVVREHAPAPVATTLIRLTERGRELQSVVLLLGSWGAPWLADAPADDCFRAHWLLMPLRLHLTDHAPDAPAVSMEIRIGGEALTVEAAAGAVRVRLGASGGADAVASGDPKTVLGLMSGRVDLNAARAAGLDYQGDPRVLARLVRAPVGPPSAP
jgi:DNA-binding HxlR family transcriptional regulator